MHPTGVLLLPGIKVQDHLSITIDVIELYQHEYSRISKLIELINNAIQKAPIPGLDSASCVINNVAGTILNLISALDDDDVIMREASTLIIDKLTYGDNFLVSSILKPGFGFSGTNWTIEQENCWHTLMQRNLTRSNLPE